MTKTGEAGTEELVSLLKHLLAIELWRGGLSQAEIKSRLGLGSETLTRMLKGVNRDLRVTSSN
jgi:Trp operon repressor